MKVTIDSSQIQKQAYYSTIIDGSYEVIQAILMFIVGFFFINLVLELITLIFFIFILINRKKILSKFKEQYVFPRLGYVELNNDHHDMLKKFRVIYAMIIASSIIISFVYVFHEGWSIDTTLKYMTILVCGALFSNTIYICLFSGKWTYLWFGIGSIFLCILFILIPFSTGKEHIIYFVWTEGCFLFCFGITKYKRFVKNNPIIEQA